MQSGFRKGRKNGRGPIAHDQVIPIVLAVRLVPRALQAIRRAEHKKADGIQMIRQQASGHLEMA